MKSCLQEVELTREQLAVLRGHEGTERMYFIIIHSLIISSSAGDNHMDVFVCSINDSVLIALCRYSF